jgi:hypothetical protein
MRTTYPALKRFSVIAVLCTLAQLAFSTDIPTAPDSETPSTGEGTLTGSSIPASQYQDINVAPDGKPAAEITDFPKIMKLAKLGLDKQMPDDQKLTYLTDATPKRLANPFQKQRYTETVIPRINALFELYKKQDYYRVPLESAELIHDPTKFYIVAGLSHYDIQQKAFPLVYRFLSDLPVENFNKVRVEDEKIAETIENRVGNIGVRGTVYITISNKPTRCKLVHYDLELFDKNTKEVYYKTSYPSSAEVEANAASADVLAKVPDSQYLDINSAPNGKAFSACRYILDVMVSAKKGRDKLMTDQQKLEEFTFTTNDVINNPLKKERFEQETLPKLNDLFDAYRHQIYYRVAFRSLGLEAIPKTFLLVGLGHYDPAKKAFPIFAGFTINNQPVLHDDGSDTTLDIAFPNQLVIQDQNIVEQIEAGFVPRNIRQWGYVSAIGTRGTAYLTIENSESATDDCPMCLRCTIQRMELEVFDKKTQTIYYKGTLSAPVK